MQQLFSSWRERGTLKRKRLYRPRLGFGSFHKLPIHKLKLSVSTKTGSANGNEPGDKTRTRPRSQVSGAIKCEDIKKIINDLSSYLDDIPDGKTIKAVASGVLENKETINCDVSVKDGLPIKALLGLIGLEECLEDFSLSFDFLMVQDHDGNAKYERHLYCLVSEFLKLDLPLKLLSQMPKVTFESRKLIVVIIAELLNIPKSSENADFASMVKKYFVPRGKSMIRTIAEMYSQDNLAIVCGLLFRKCLEHSFLYKECLSKDNMVLTTLFTKNTQTQCFDVVSDTFVTCEVIFTKDKKKVARFLDSHYEEMKSLFSLVLDSENYVSQRWSLRLLFSLLFERENYSFMIKYISDKENLIRVMKLMSNESAPISLRAFNVFKVFVANPKKCAQINNILYRNKQTLILYVGILPDMQHKYGYRQENVISNHEQNYLINIFENLEFMKPDAYI